MKSVKLKLVSVLALAVAFVATLGAFLGITVANARTATVTGASTTLFSASGKAEVWAHEVAGEEEEDSKFYSMFVFKESDDAIAFKKNLAYKWFYNATPSAETEEGEEAQPTTLTKGEGWLNMEFGFELGSDEKLGFESFVLTFEGQEYSQTKEGKSVNYIVFKPATDGRHVYVLVTDNGDEESWVIDEETDTALDVDKIKIEFTDRVYDEYLVKISDGTNGLTADAEGNALSFKNVGGTYSKYSASSVTPMTFSVKYPEVEQDEDSDVTENAYTRMALYNFNGQSFELTGTTEKDGHASGGTLNDDTPAVLCLDKEVTFIKGGSEISFSYTAIDVLTSSSSAQTSYFLLTKDQAANKDGKFNPEDVSENGPYTKVTSGDNQKLIYDVNTYIPKAGTDYQSENYGEDFNVDMALKICLTLTDTATDGVSCEVLLDWYVDEAYLLDINGYKYIAVGKDEAGATFGYTDTANKTSDPEDEAWLKAVEEYAQQVAEAAEKQELKAGNKNYFYLPSVESLLGDNATPYKDLTFNLYYMYEGTSTFQSSTGKAANALSINLAKEGKYIFTVLATDGASNKMYYYKNGADGEPEKVEIGTATSDILNFYNEEENSDYEDTKKYLPWFEFYVNASELSIEDPGEQKTAYVGNTYSSISFTINGVSHTETYNLYLFRNDLYFADTGKVMEYDYFMEHKAELLENDESRKWFNEITDDDIYSDYAWNGTDSFVPQIGNAFYLVKCTVKDGDDYSDRTETAYMGILAAPQVRNLEGEDMWLQNNLTSVVLLCIAGVSLVGIILLLVIKPKNKGDVDEEFEALKTKSSKSKKK